MEKHILKYNGEEIDHLLAKIEQAPDAIASEAYVQTEVANLVNSAPETLDTLGEVAKAIEDNETVVEALNAAIGNKADKSYVDSKVTNTSLTFSAKASEAYMSFNSLNPTTGSLFKGTCMCKTGDNQDVILMIDGYGGTKHYYYITYDKTSSSNSSESVLIRADSDTKNGKVNTTWSSNFQNALILVEFYIYIESSTKTHIYGKCQTTTGHFSYFGCQKPMSSIPTSFAFSIYNTSDSTPVKKARIEKLI